MLNLLHGPPTGHVHQFGIGKRLQNTYHPGCPLSPSPEEQLAWEDCWRSLRCDTPFPFQMPESDCCGIPWLWWLWWTLLLGPAQRQPTLRKPAAPLKCKHLTWNCSLTGPAGPFPVNALIDSGAHMVLIWPDLVHKLKLPILPLQTPELVNVTIALNTPSLPLSHYVLSCPASLSDTFTSRPIHAVLANNLSVPLILRLPFLTNEMSCNYAKCECIIMVKGWSVNILARPHRSPTTPNYNHMILAALHECARLPGPDHTLHEYEMELQAQFSSMFEPLPHASELPKQPVARIKLKDPDTSINIICKKDISIYGYICMHLGQKMSQVWRLRDGHIWSVNNHKQLYMD